MWVGLHHPKTFAGDLSKLIPLQFAEPAPLGAPPRTMDQINQWVRDYVGLTSDNRPTKQNVHVEASSPPDWTGQDFPVGSLMQAAVRAPKAFCASIAAAFLRPPTRR